MSRNLYKRDRIRWKRLFGLFGGLIFGILSAAAPAFAEETEEHHRLTICFSTENHENAVRGAEFSVLRIAEKSGAGSGDGFSPAGGSAEFGTDFWERFSEGDADLAKEVLEFVQKEKTAGAGERTEDGGTVTFSEVRIMETDSEGRAVFDNLGEGVYLVWESGAKDQAASYEIASPVLAAVPADEKDGAGSEDVTVYPKTTPVHKKEEISKNDEADPVPSSAPDKSGKSSSKTEMPVSNHGRAGVVRTGDDSGLEAAVLIASVAAASGICLMTGRKKKER